MDALSGRRTRAAAGRGLRFLRARLRPSVGGSPTSPGASAWDLVTTVLESAPDAMLLVDRDGIIVLVNRQSELLFGYPRGELVGRPVEVLVPPGLRGRHRSHREVFASSPTTRMMGAPLALTAARRDGSAVPVEISLSPLDSSRGPLVVAAVRDVSRRRETERALQESETRFRLTFDASPIGIALIGLDGRWLRVNQALCDLTGYAEDELLSMTLADLAEEGPAADEELPAPAARPDVRREQHHYVRADGTRIWVDLTRSTVRSEDGTPLHEVAQFQDVTALRHHQAELQVLALSDPLTGLPNRNLLLDRAAHALTGLQRRPGRVSMLLIDLDGFKHVNDTLGHQAGDELLRETAHRLRATARAVDTVARFGGDEFAVLTLDLPAQEEVRLANRLLEALSRPVPVPTSGGSVETVTITASIGIAGTHDRTAEPDDLYREADLAMYEAKTQGRARAARRDAGTHRLVVVPGSGPS